MNATVTHSLDQIIEETQSFQSLIDNEAWDELDQKLKLRQEKLENIFALPIIEEEKETVIGQLSQVANLDKVYQSQLQKNRKQSTNNVLQFRRKHDAANAYKTTENQ